MQFKLHFKAKLISFFSSVSFGWNVDLQLSGQHLCNITRDLTELCPFCFITEIVRTFWKPHSCKTYSVPCDSYFIGNTLDTTSSWTTGAISLFSIFSRIQSIWTNSTYGHILYKGAWTQRFFCGTCKHGINIAWYLHSMMNCPQSVNSTQANPFSLLLIYPLHEWCSHKPALVSK